MDSAQSSVSGLPTTRSYQEEMLQESLRRNTIIAMDTGSGKTHISILRMKIESERESFKVSWFLAPTVGLCEQQRDAIANALPLSVGLISGALEPDHWKDAELWKRALNSHRIIVSTPQVLLDALRHGYVHLGRDVCLLVFDEAHHAADKHPYNMIMREFYDRLSPRSLLGNAQGRTFVQPFVLGLTASPIFGGRVREAFNAIERNLDSSIISPRHTRDDLASYIHPPTFKHIVFPAIDYREAHLRSVNTVALGRIVDSLDIRDDPSVKALQERLRKTPGTSDEYRRLDQRLSKMIDKKDSFAHKGLKDFHRTAKEICAEVGLWAADWFVEAVVTRVLNNSKPSHILFGERHALERAYLFKLLNSVQITPVSFESKAVIAGTSPKAKKLIVCLLAEKASKEIRDEFYSGLVFVTRRDAVIALAELLSHHPFTKERFKIGTLLGSSDSSRRNSFLDITRTLVKQTQAATLGEFRIGEKNLLISTAVAEEGIDIQACGCVIRWDIPQNMVSWTQSRGRARRKRSTFVLMFEEGGVHDSTVKKWVALEQEMISMYMDELRLSIPVCNAEEEDDDEQEDGREVLRVESTGATLTINSAISHLTHFCSILPNSAHADNYPIYDITPPEYPTGFHSATDTAHYPSKGPFGATVILPRLLPPDLREHSIPEVCKTRTKAKKRAAFKAYVSLYRAGLLTDDLLPFDGVVEQDLGAEVKELLKKIEHREGLAKVGNQINPWLPYAGDTAKLSDVHAMKTHWFISVVSVDGISSVFGMLTKVAIPSSDVDDTLYDPERGPRRFRVKPNGWKVLSPAQVSMAQNFTRRLFCLFYGMRMDWHALDFAYLFLPAGDNAEKSRMWEERRLWAEERVANSDEKRKVSSDRRMICNAAMYGSELAYPDDIAIVLNTTSSQKYFRFRSWRYDPLTDAEKGPTLMRYARVDDVQISYPVIVATPLHKRMNFLHPPANDAPVHSPEPVILLPQYTAVALVSPADIEFSLVAPSIIRSMAINLTATGLRKSLLTSPSLSSIPLSLVRNAIVTPVSSHHYNYQRLESLGDAIMKFVTGLQLLDEHPTWHEGYLTRRRDHAVSNVKLAHSAIHRRLYQWIVRDRFVPRKWKPDYTYEARKESRKSAAVLPTESGGLAEVEILPKPDTPKGRKRSKADPSQISTKVLADVVESLVGAAYLAGGLERSVECLQVANIGIDCKPVSDRVAAIFNRVEPSLDNPEQLSYVESMLGYTFSKKLLLIEALMHASCQSGYRTVSYERLEFLGDSLLDVVVSESLFHAEGKNYSPGHIHIRKSAMVNVHFLSFICLRTHHVLESQMHRWDAAKGTLFETETRKTYLWQCLMHSSHRILDDQSATFSRFKRGRSEIEQALLHGDTYPWAALTRLQAPKFFSDMIESLLGAVYLDCGGDMRVIHSVLEKLEILPILRRVISENVDVTHPVSRVAIWASKHFHDMGKSPKYAFTRHNGLITCTLAIDNEELALVTERYNGKASREEVKFRAAELAMRKLAERSAEVSSDPKSLKTSSTS